MYHAATTPAHPAFVGKARSAVAKQDYAALKLADAMLRTGKWQWMSERGNRTELALLRTDEVSEAAIIVQLDPEGDRVFLHPDWTFWNRIRREVAYGDDDQQNRPTPRWRRPQ